MRRAAVILLCLLAVAGCSQAGPQAPLPDAKTINTLTGDISSACGLHAQLTALSTPSRHDLLVLRTSAASALRKLTAIDRAHPQWRFDGVAMPTILRQSHAMLRSCGLA